MHKYFQTSVPNQSNTNLHILEEEIQDATMKKTPQAMSLKRIWGHNKPATQQECPTDAIRRKEKWHKGGSEQEPGCTLLLFMAQDRSIMKA